MDFTQIIEIVTIYLFSVLKFVFTPSYCIIRGYSLYTTVFMTSTGGIIGMFAFYNFGSVIFNWYDRFFSNPNKPKKLFTSSNRNFVRFLRKFGLLGLALISPLFPSIPIGSMLAAKYFHYKPKVYSLFALSIVFWSCVLTGITYWIKSGI